VGGREGAGAWVIGERGRGRLRGVETGASAVTLCGVGGARCGSGGGVVRDEGRGGQSAGGRGRGRRPEAREAERRARRRARPEGERQRSGGARPRRGRGHLPLPSLLERSKEQDSSA